MLLFLMLGAASAFQPESIGYFIDKPVRIFFSNANHVFLGFDTKTKTLTARSKYDDLSKFLATFRVSQHGTGQYHITAGEDHTLCIDSETVKECSKPSEWTFTEQVFGYTISNKSQCMTLPARGSIKMAACTSSDDQILDIKLVDPESECDKTKCYPEENPAKSTSVPLPSVIEMLKHAHENYHHHHEASPVLVHHKPTAKVFVEPKNVQGHSVAHSPAYIEESSEELAHPRTLSFIPHGHRLPKRGKVQIVEDIYEDEKEPIYLNAGRKHTLSRYYTTPTSDIHYSPKDRIIETLYHNYNSGNMNHLFNRPISAA